MAIGESVPHLLYLIDVIRWWPYELFSDSSNSPRLPEHWLKLGAKWRNANPGEKSKKMRVRKSGTSKGFFWQLKCYSMILLWISIIYFVSCTYEPKT